MLYVWVSVLFRLKLIIVGDKWTPADNLLAEDVDVDKHLFPSAWEGSFIFYQKSIVINTPHLPNQGGEIYHIPSTTRWVTFLWRKLPCYSAVFKSTSSMPTFTKISPKAWHTFLLRLLAWTTTSVFSTPFLIQGTVFAVLWLQGAIFHEREICLTFPASILPN